MNVKLKKRTATSVMALTIMTVFVAVTVMPALAAAMPAAKDGWQEKGMGRPCPSSPALGIWRNPQLAEKLGLTDEQISQLREADFNTREQCLEARAQLDRLRLQMDRAFSQDNIDQAGVRKVAQQMADVKGSLLVQKVESRLAVGQILNADQISMLRQQVMQRGKQGPKNGDKCGAKSHHAK